MATKDDQQFVRDFFQRLCGAYREAVSRLVDDADRVFEEATAIHEEMIPDMAYVGNRGHTMASAVFACSGNLALYQALRTRGVDAHQWGRAVLNSIQPGADAERPTPRQFFQRMQQDAEASLADAAPNEFVFELLPRNDAEPGWGMNVKSCAICHLFAKYDAMDLVPYMCASDDAESDRGNLGLRRTGSIALGAHQCDFRYKRGGEPMRLVDRYPDQIRLVED